MRENKKASRKAERAVCACHTPGLEKGRGEAIKKKKAFASCRCLQCLSVTILHHRRFCPLISDINLRVK